MLVIVVLAVLVNAPMPPSTVLYKSVLAKKRLGKTTCDQHGCRSEEVVAETKVEGTVDKLFAIHRGQLFLRFQRTWPSMIIVTWVSFDDWNESRVAKLRKDHPELESYWPEPARKDGGLQWTATQSLNERTGATTSHEPAP